jgi:thioester reductase-like protein
MELLARFLERDERQVHVLVRADDRRAADARVRSTLACLFGDENAYADRIVPVTGDIERPGLGLEPKARDALAERVSEIVHSAASVSFTLPIEQSREINVNGTRRMIEFGELCARRGGIRRFSYISTAYVAGTHSGEFAEDQLDVGQDFRNPYERSKFEAEKVVRSRRTALPIQIFRPSIVVGERSTGWTASFNVLYSPLKAFAKGALPAVPARRSSPVDIVPVDYVADAVYELSRQPLGGQDTYHLVAGQNATTVGRLIELTAERLERRRPIVIPPPLYRRFVVPLIIKRGAQNLRNAIDRMSVFFPYFAMKVAYRNEAARSRLDPVGVQVPPVETYFDRLLDYAIRAHWGRETIARAEAARLAEDLEAPRPVLPD